MASGTFYPAVSGDDGYWDHITPSGFNNSDVEMFFGYQSGESTNQYRSFIRFVGVTIPVGATITSAVLTVTSNQSEGEVTVSGRVQGVDDDNPDAPTDVSEADGLTLTTEYVDWATGAWSTGTEYDSPDLTDIIQEIIDRAAWASNDALMLVLLQSTASGSMHSIRTYDNSEAAYRAELFVEWTEAGMGLISVSGTLNLVNGIQFGSTLELVNSLNVELSSNITLVNNVLQVLEGALTLKLSIEERSKVTDTIVLLNRILDTSGVSQYNYEFSKGHGL